MCVGRPGNLVAQDEAEIADDGNDDDFQSRQGQGLVKLDKFQERGIEQNGKYRQRIDEYDGNQKAAHNEASLLNGVY